MANDEGMTNAERRMAIAPQAISSFGIRHWEFVIRHSSVD
jgi:hypothetical protein